MKKPRRADEELLQLYNEVDHYLRQNYKQDRYADHSFLIQEMASKNRVVVRHQQVMRAVAQIRNSLVHNPIPSIAQPISSPNPELVKTYRAVRDALLNPKTALSIAVPGSKIYSATLDDKLLDVMKVMDKNIFTHVPIIKNDKMIGIFSENALLSYLVDSGETIITKDMKISDLREFLPLSAHRGEIFAFLPRRAPLSEVYEAFNKAIKVHDRIGMLFITEHGRVEEKPLGIITAWDLATPESEVLL
jgi:CBS domain-containing protein